MPIDKAESISAKPGRADDIAKCRQRRRANRVSVCSRLVTGETVGQDSPPSSRLGQPGAEEVEEIGRHYRRIAQYIQSRSRSRFRGASRQGNRNFLVWWRHGSRQPGLEDRLNGRREGLQDYTWLVRCRSLYSTTAFFAPDVFQRSVPDDPKETRLGGPEDIVAIEPFVDIVR